MRNRSRGIGLAVLFVVGSMTTMFAQSSIESAKVPRGFLRRATPRTGHAKDSAAARGRNKKAAGRQLEGRTWDEFPTNKPEDSHR